MSITPFISVIVPVFNDSERLTNCLKALEEQTYPKDMYEVIVVDNGSNESIEKALELCKQAYSTYENQPGSYAARNKGISMAKGEIIAFTDSDCTPASNWLETGIKHFFSVPNCGLVAGKIEIFFKNPNKPTIIELYDSAVFLQQNRFVKEERYGATANLLTFKKVFEDVGIFNSNLKSGGDKEWGKRVHERGYVLIYADDSKVKHPARSSLNQIYKKATRVSGGIYDLDKISQTNIKNSFLQFFKNILLVLKPPIRSTFLKFHLDKRLNKIQKLKIFSVAILIYYFKSFEIIRLSLGGSAKRQ